MTFQLFFKKTLALLFVLILSIEIIFLLSGCKTTVDSSPSKKVASVHIKTEEEWLVLDSERYLSVHKEFDKKGHVIHEIKYRKDGSISEQTDDIDDYVLTTLYDANGEISTIIKTKYEYDQNGDIIRITKCSGVDEIVIEDVVYERDSNGNKTKETNYGMIGGELRKLNSIEREYDSSGNIIKQLSYGMVSDNPIEVHEYSYDKNGNEIASITYVDGKVTSESKTEYDSNNNVILRKTISESKTEEKKYRYEYDDDGNILNSFVCYSEGKETPYEIRKYTSKGNLSAVFNFRTGEDVTPYDVSSIELYDAKGSLCKLRTVESYNDCEIQYNSDGYLSDIQWLYEGFLIKGKFEYDSKGLITHKEIFDAIYYNNPAYKITEYTYEFWE